MKEPFYFALALLSANCRLFDFKLIDLVLFRHELTFEVAQVVVYDDTLAEGIRRRSLLGARLETADFLDRDKFAKVLFLNVLYREWKIPMGDSN